MNRKESGTAGKGRADAERAALSPRRLVSWLMSQPDKLPAHRRSHLDELLDACPHLSVLAARVAAFADLLTARRSGDLDAWMASVDNDDLPTPAVIERSPELLVVPDLLPRIVVPPRPAHETDRRILVRFDHLRYAIYCTPECAEDHATLAGATWASYAAHRRRHSDREA